MNETSYDVRVWDIDLYHGKRRSSYRVRWVVDGKRWTRTFATKQLAVSHRSKLVTAARDGQGFTVATGLPVTMTPRDTGPTWYEHAREFALMKWQDLAPRSRISLAEGLAAVTPALLEERIDGPTDSEIRHTLRSWSFRPDDGRADEVAARTHAWLQRHSLPLGALEDPTVTRRCLDMLTQTIEGRIAAPTTIARKRATFYGALKYSVELGRLPYNPIDRVSWRKPRSTDAVDPAAVVNPTQARALLAAVRAVDPAMEAFFALMYFAALRPAEALHVRERDVVSPHEGWGELNLTGSTQRTGALWSEDGETYEDRALKHRATRARRTVPACPELCRILNDHITTFGTGPDGRLFVTRTGEDRRALPGELARPVSPASYGTKWRRARAAALTPEQVASPLARRPYDLRHACVSTWLAAGVPTAQVAQWAGHGVAVLLRTYTHAIDGGHDAALRRIETELGTPPSEL